MNNWLDKVRARDVQSEYGRDKYPTARISQPIADRHNLLRREKLMRPHTGECEKITMPVFGSDWSCTCGYDALMDELNGS